MSPASPSATAVSNLIISDKYYCIKDNGTFLFDCGEGTTRQMNTSQTKPHDVSAVFLTHLHGDHYYGIPGLGMNLLDSAFEPDLYAPVGLQGCFSGAMGLRGFKLHNVQKPRSTPESVVEMGSATKGMVTPTRSVAKNIFYDHQQGCYRLHTDKHFIVRAQPIKHSIFCLGFVIEEITRPNINQGKLLEYGLAEGPIVGRLSRGEIIVLPDGRRVSLEDVSDPPRKPRKVVILGDTCDPSAIAPLAMDADVLVHEATCSNEEKTIALQQMHSTAGMAGSFARRIRAKNLILTHFSPRNFKNNEFDEALHIRTIVEQARKAFGNANVFPAHDFWRFEVNRNDQLDA